MQNGYAGKFLQVDLTSGVPSNFTIEEERLKKFIGGNSLAASLYLEKFNLVEKHCMQDFSPSICHFLLYCMAPGTVHDAFHAITGFNFTFKDFLKCGAHDWTRKCGINNLPGITGADDVLPKKKWMQGKVQYRI
jgi:aldehyde:ferredoxin oxidoreductase